MWYKVCYYLGMRCTSNRGWSLGSLAVAALALSSVACGAHSVAPPQAPLAAPSMAASPAAARAAETPEETKTVTIDFAFDRDTATRDFDKTFDDGFEKKGLKVEQSLTAHAHFDVKDAKITGTVTYVKKSNGEYVIVAADLVTSGHYDADVQVDLDVRAKGDARKATGAEWEKALLGGRPVPLARNVMAANIPIVGPLSLHAHFDLSAACEMQVEGPMHATTGVGISGDVRLGAKYVREGAEGASKPSLQFEAKAPTFELTPKPYLKVDGKQQHMKGHCSLKPTAVLDIDPSFGARIAVEPYVDVDAKRATARDKWVLDAQAGVSMTAASDVALLDRKERKQNEYALLDAKLSKPGDEMGAPTRNVGPAAPPKTGRAAKVEVASVLDAGLGAASAAAPPAAPRTARGAFGKKKKL
jgi:hypothetical protein